MAEPTSTATATLAAAAAAVPALSVAGVPLGLRPDLLLAGFNGSIVAIILLNSVPGTGDTWRELLRTTLSRIMVAVASSLTAGYLAPLALLLASLPESLLLGGAFAVGAGAQQVLMAAIRRLGGRPAAAGEGAP
ncbi:MAG: hypothetical protein ACRECD_01080 [Burkholderiaceae bacterium]